MRGFPPSRERLPAGVLREKGKNRTLRAGTLPERAEFTRFHLGKCPPEVIPAQIDVLPAQRGQELEELIAQIRVLKENCPGGALQVGGVPEDNSGNDEAESAGAVALLVKAPVPDFTEPVEEDRSREGIAGLAFVEPERTLCCGIKPENQRAESSLNPSTMKVSGLLSTNSGDPLSGSSHSIPECGHGLHQFRVYDCLNVAVSNPVPT